MECLILSKACLFLLCTLFLVALSLYILSKYDPGICTVVQGRKIGYLGGQKLQYDAGNYLVVSVTMPFECQTFASPEEPLLGLCIDVGMGRFSHSISEKSQAGQGKGFNGAGKHESLHRR